jgi:tetratricopeptide (TPR) repeat protein
LESRRLDARHLPFFAALGTLDVGSPEWLAAKAGLVTLRLVDSWVAQGPRVLSTGSRAQRAVEAAVGELPSDAERQLLTNIIAATTRAPEPAVSYIAAPLLAYAYALQVRAAWALAADVYETVVCECGAAWQDQSRCDAVAAATAALRSGFCYRQLGDRARAEEAYTVAETLGGTYIALRAQLGRANLAVDRGNLPVAEELCEAVLAVATEAGFSDVHAYALHDRAHVAFRRGEYQLSVSLAFDAWVRTSDPAERDRVLVGLASALTEVGEREAARDGNLILAATAHDPSIRWIATINLIELAALDRREVDFSRHRLALARAPLPPRLAGHYHFYVARGYQTFGDTQRADAAYERALAIAEEHELNELIFQIEATRAVSVDTGAVPRPDAEPGFAEVASAIRGARQLAGVHG